MHLQNSFQVENQAHSSTTRPMENFCSKRFQNQNSNSWNDYCQTTWIICKNFDEQLWYHVSMDFIKCVLWNETGFLRSRWDLWSWTMFFIQTRRFKFDTIWKEVLKDESPSPVRVEILSQRLLWKILMWWTETFTLCFQRRWKHNSWFKYVLIVSSFNKTSLLITVYSSESIL